METGPPAHKARFGAFEVDFRSGELHKHGIRLKLQDQPFHVLALLLEHPGEVVTRDDLRQKLWPADTFVDFDTGLNSAVKKLRDVLGDSADEPRYIETLPKRGYRFIAAVENGHKPAPIEETSSAVNVADQPETLRKSFNTRRFVAIAAVALLILGGIFAWRTLYARPALNDSDVIVVTSFVNNTGDPIFNESLDKALEVKLTESPFLSVFPEASVRETMRTMRRDPNERVTRDLGIEICKRQGLKAVVVPQIAAFGSRYLITLEGIDARTEKLLARRQSEADSKDKVIAALGDATSRLRRSLGESLRTLESYNTPLELATTSSLEALQAYRTGAALYRSGKVKESVPFFERAVELDGQFCSAHNMLGMAYHSTNDKQSSNMHFAKAFELKDRRLTREENFQTTALYNSAITGNLDKEAAVLALYKQAYPRSAFAFNLTGIAYAQQGRTEESLQEFYQAIDRSAAPTATQYSNASQALLLLGRFDEAKKLLEQWQQKGSLIPTQNSVRYRIAFFQNDAATMEKIIRDAPTDNVTYLAAQMQVAVFRGNFKKLRSLGATLTDVRRRANRMEDVAFSLAWHARFESAAGNYVVARALCREAQDAAKESFVWLGNCGKALADAGEVVEAEGLTATLDRQRAEDTAYQKIYIPVIRSAIELHLGNAAKAVDLLAPVKQYEEVISHISYNRGLAFLAAGQPAEAEAEFEKLLDHRGWFEWEVYAPLAQLGLARAYAMQGNRDESRKAYDEFFATWKDADPDIPVLVQARSEYNKIPAKPSTVAAVLQK